MAKIYIKNNFEQGTAGIASASQLIESTSSYSIEFGTLPSIVVKGSLKKKQEEERQESIVETLLRITRRHKEALDKLDES